MLPGNQPDSYAPPATGTGFFGSFCNAVSSCLGLLCCCWLFRDCLGRQRGTTTPLMAPPVAAGHSPFGGVSNPPGPPGPMDDRLGELGGPHSPFGSSAAPGLEHRPPSRHGLLVHPGPPHPHGPPGLPEPPPRVPSLQPGLL
ncbi:hypothetical protein SSX86_029443 [Deinandra increscens subsp. villosa]|uniref:Uncharacterized protein n=1 Tax=Deinandra increscens subsp. villosa TaxID=3103831 RepID=A0AAP0GK47_9ASTR